MWHSFYTSEPKVILKHCPTRWLSLLRCIERYLYQLPGLISYFLSCEQTAKVVSITKPFLLFLKHVLPFMDRFNRNFQKSSENNTCELLTEINQLVRIYAVNVLTQNSVLQVGNKIHTIDLDNSTNHKPDENMSIGTDTWECVAELEEEINIKPFFSAVRQFYLATLKKMFHLEILYSKIWVLFSQTRHTHTLWTLFIDWQNVFLKLNYPRLNPLILSLRNLQISFFHLVIFLL